MAKRRSRRGLSLTGTIVAFILIIAAALFQDQIDLDLTDDADRIDETQFGDLQTIALDQGFGAGRDFWQVYFTAPGVNRNDETACAGGIDEVVVGAIDTVQSSLDIAAFEWDNACLTDAVVRAANRGVQVRMVVDDVHTVREHEDATLFGDPSPFGNIINAGIPYRDDSRSGLMHNKFMILDRSIVVTGSMNFTLNGVYRNNNNLVLLRSSRAAEIYQAEFNEMFEQGEFGSSRSTVDGGAFNQDGVPVRINFSPEDQPVSVLEQEIRNAQQSVRFMVFSFTRDDIGMALLDRAQAGVDVAGIFETTGSRTQFSELPRLLCAGVPVFQDGNPGIFHHKVFIVDGSTVVTGSFNISDAATTSNDENVVIIRDPDIAALYLAEYERARREATVPPAAEIVCP